MNTRLVELNKIHANKKNPRTISADKFKKLINSLLSLPKMLEIRPIAIDGKGVSLGGNMRLRALNEIAKMSADELSKRLDTIRDVKKKTAEERKSLLDYWVKWAANPVAPIADASTLTPAEQKEFIIKDNGDFGQWDYDALANEWDADDLNDWGVDVWQNKEVDEVFNAGSATATETPANGSALSPEAAEILANEQDNDAPVSPFRGTGRGSFGRESRRYALHQLYSSRQPPSRSAHYPASLDGSSCNTLRGIGRQRSVRNSTTCGRCRMPPVSSCRFRGRRAYAG